MSTVWLVCELVLAASLAFSGLLVAALVFAAWRGSRHERRVATVHRPTVPALARSLAVPCKCCWGPVRYQDHPAGRADALALHLAFECDPPVEVGHPSKAVKINERTH